MIFPFLSPYKSIACLSLCDLCGKNIQHSFKDLKHFVIVFLPQISQRERQAKFLIPHLQNSASKLNRLCEQWVTNQPLSIALIDGVEK